MEFPAPLMRVDALQELLVPTTPIRRFTLLYEDGPPPLKTSPRIDVIASPIFPLSTNLPNVPGCRLPLYLSSVGVVGGRCNSHAPPPSRSSFDLSLFIEIYSGIATSLFFSIRFSSAGRSFFSPTIIFFFPPEDNSR